MTFEKIYDQVNLIPGWSGPEDCKLLSDLASKIEGGTIVEIGTYCGRSALCLALSSPTSKVYTIDNGKMGGTVPEHAKQENIEYLTGTSWQIPWDKPIDLLFIDGNHFYSRVKRDYQHFRRFVKPGGVIVFHDYGNKKYTVKRLVDESLSRFRHFTVEAGIAVCYL